MSPTTLAVEPGTTAVASSLLETPVRHAQLDGSSLASRTSTSGNCGKVSRFGISSHPVIPMVLGDSGHLGSGTMVTESDMLIVPIGANLVTLTIVPMVLVECTSLDGARRSSTPTQLHRIWH